MSAIASPAVHENTADLTVIGGGVVGLWTALVAARRGLSVHLVEKRTIGAGASGGMLGALMPHQPNAWSGKKGFQLKGLLTLPESLQELEAETGLSCGYARTGRLMPIRHAEKRRQSQDWADGAQGNWPAGMGGTIIDGDPAPGWLDPATGPSGFQHDLISARIDPRRLMAALEARLRADPQVMIIEGETITALPEGPCVIAAGIGSSALIDPANPARIGTGVKGQGARLQPARPVDPGLPLIYADGIYIIAHGDGMIAVGSTTETTFDDPASTDHQLDDVIASARSICPALEGATVIERWAGLRPRAGKPDPLLGPLPGHRHAIIATGGFKITFGIAHVMADAAVAFAMGGTPDVPEPFLPENRLR